MTEFKKGTPWLVLTPEMKQFEKSTGKKAVYNGKITGQFEYWLYQQNKNVVKPKSKIIKPKPEQLSKSKLSKKELHKTLERDIKEFEPSKDYPGKFPKKVYVDDKYKLVIREFYNLGNWKEITPSASLTYEWVDRKKFSREFRNWAKNKFWYGRVICLVKEGEDDLTSEFILKIK